jgi:RNA polymerase sigma-70 factor (ECF subfamily)
VGVTSFDPDDASHLRSGWGDEDRHQRPPPHRDATLVDWFRSGSPAALAAVYDQYARAVWTVAFGVLGNQAMADDAVQETFVRAWRAAGRFDPAKPFGPWLFTIARRSAIDLYRGEMRPTRGDHGPETDVVVDLPGIELAWQQWEVRRAVANLTGEEQAVVRLAHYRGMTHSQIAAHLGLPLGTVKSRSHRAHRRLAVLLRHVRDESRDRFVP